MRGVPWRSIGLAAIGAVIVVVAFIPDPTSQGLSTWSTSPLIDARTSDRASVRRAAVGQLVARARTDIPDLERAAMTLSGERMEAVFDVLEELMLSPNEVVAETAEVTLERLARPPQSEISDTAVRVLLNNATLRHARALAHCQELGGRIVQPAVIPSVSGGVAPRILVVDKNWTGGDEGLKYVARLFPGEVLALHVADNSPVTEAGLREISSRRGNLYVRSEGEPCLGVVVDYRSDWGAGVRISEVISDSPAAIAGLRRGDVIYELDGEPVDSFATMRRISLLSQPGERVEMRVYRDSRKLRIKLALGTDFATGNCHCVAPATAMP